MTDCDALLKVDPHLAGRTSSGPAANSSKATWPRRWPIAMRPSVWTRVWSRPTSFAEARLEKSSLMRTLAEVQECGQAADDCHAALELAKKSHGDADWLRRLRSLRGQAHESRGAIYHAVGATPKALAEYGQALALDPYLISALLGRAMTRARGDDTAGAMYDCETAIRIDSTRAEAYSGRGFIYALNGDYAKAVEDFTLAIKLDGKFAKAYLDAPRFARRWRRWNCLRRRRQPTATT